MTLITNASRGVRVGTRASKAIRIIRVFRLIRIFKLYKHGNSAIIRKHPQDNILFTERQSRVEIKNPTDNLLAHITSQQESRRGERKSGKLAKLN